MSHNSGWNAHQRSVHAQQQRHQEQMQRRQHENLIHTLASNPDPNNPTLRTARRIDRIIGWTLAVLVLAGLTFGAWYLLVGRHA